MSLELVQIPFHGDVLEAMKDGDKAFASLRRFCENLGIDFASQFKKLKSKAWACIVEMTIHDTTGREQPATMLALDSLPMWLAMFK